MARPEDADEEVTAMLQEVRTLSKEAFFGEDSVQKAEDRGTARTSMGLVRSAYYVSWGRKYCILGNIIGLF